MRIKRQRNCRKSRKMNVMTGRTFHVAGIILALVVAVVMNLVADARCTQVSDSIGEKSQLLKRLEQDRQREMNNWDQMTTEANLERALIRHSLNMRYAKDEQIIRMDDTGSPRPGQRSVELARNRLATPSTVATVRPRAHKRR